MPAKKHCTEEARREAKRKSHLKYRSGDKGKAASQRRERVPARRMYMQAYQVAYRASAHGQSTIAARNASERGRMLKMIRNHMRASQGDVSYEDVERLLRTSVCYYCGTGVEFVPAKLRLPFAVTIDHRVPISRGGRSDKANLVAACAHCNSSKRNLTDTEFFVYRREVACALRYSTA